MANLQPNGELIRDRNQIRDTLLTAFDGVIQRTSAADSDEMAARILIDTVTYVISFKVPDGFLDDDAEINAFTRNETLRFEMYLREHLLRRGESGPLTIADGDNIPTQPTDPGDGEPIGQGPQPSAMAPSYEPE